MIKMAQQFEIDRTFHKKGVVVVMVEKAHKLDLRPSDIIANISKNKKEIADLNQKILNAEAMIVNCRRAIPHLKKTIKQMSEFEQWAIEVQESKLKSIVEDIRVEIITEVESVYKPDSGLTDLQNEMQKFRQYQMKIATHEKVASEINPELNRKLLFTECILDNPWETK